jgi:NADH dehydrogenase
LKLAVVGGTGFVGRGLLRALAQSSHDVVVVSRRPPKNIPAAKNFQFAAGDIHDAKSLDKAFTGAQVVYHLVGIIAETRELTFEKTVIQGTGNLIDAARACGVKRIIYLSALGTSDKPFTKYFRAKWESEEIIRNSGLEFVILRPSFVFGPEDISINKFARIFKWLPFAPVMGDGRYKVQPIFIDDLASVMVASLDNRRAVNQTIEIGGPEVLEFRELVQIIKKSLNIRRFNLYIPFWLMMINAWVIERFLKPAPVTVDQLKMLRAGGVADNSKLLEIFGINLTSFESKIKEYLR